MRKSVQNIVYVLMAILYALFGAKHQYDRVTESIHLAVVSMTDIPAPTPAAMAVGQDGTEYWFDDNCIPDGEVGDTVEVIMNGGFVTNVTVIGKPQ